VKLWEWLVDISIVVIMLFDDIEPFYLILPVCPVILTEASESWVERCFNYVESSVWL
jgi:hypothetical protein